MDWLLCGLLWVPLVLVARKHPHLKTLAVTAGLFCSVVLAMVLYR